MGTSSSDSSRCSSEEKGYDSDENNERKYHKNGETNGIDRISALPDSLIVHILDFMTMEVAVQTSMLSKRWVYLWTHMSNLVFDLYDNTFVSHVNRNLKQKRLHGSSKIKRFIVKDFEYNHDYKDDVDSWVQLAKREGAVELGLEFKPYHHEERYFLTHHLYTNSSLTKLSIGYCVFPLKGGHICWTSLRELSIDGVRLSDEMLETILSGSPALEYLKLMYCWGFSRIHITSQIMKKLVLDGYSDEYDDAETTEDSSDADFVDDDFSDDDSSDDDDDDDDDVDDDDDDDDDDYAAPMLGNVGPNRPIAMSGDADTSEADCYNAAPLGNLGPNSPISGDADAAESSDADYYDTDSIGTAPVLGNLGPNLSTEFSGDFDSSNSDYDADSIDAAPRLGDAYSSDADSYAPPPPVLEIFGPNLCSIEISVDLKSRRCSLINVSSLVVAVVGCEVYRSDSSYIPQEANMLIELLESLHHVKELTIGDWCMKVLSSVKYLPSPLPEHKCLILNIGRYVLLSSRMEELHHMRRYSMSGDFDYFWMPPRHEFGFPGIASLLKTSPFLEKLVIKISHLDLMSTKTFLEWYDFEKGEKYWTAQGEAFKDLELSIKNVEVFDSSTSGNIIESLRPLLQFLLKNAKELEKMVIHRQEVDAQLMSSLLSFPRSSPHALVLFKRLSI